VRAPWILLALAACGAPAEQLDVPPLVPGAPIPWPTITIKNDADAMKVWGYLDPRGRDYHDKVASIPVEFRAAMALGLLDDGKLACEPEDVVDACGHHELRIPEPAPDSGLDDGCLRRKLAVWALGVVGLERAGVALDGFARLPLPERDLHRALLQRAGYGGVGWALAVEDTGDEETADAYAATQRPEDLAVLAQHGVDGAIEALIAEDAGADALGNAVHGTGHVRRETWLHVIAALQRERLSAGPVTVITIDRAIATLVATGDCQLGGAAGISDSAYRQTAASTENWNYMACFWIAAQGPASPFLRADLVSGQGIDVRRTDAQGAVTSHVDVDAGFTMPYADELPDALEDCAGTECPVPGTGVTFRLHLDAGGRLDAIERYDAGGC
jgi:hypothetical protein